MGMFYILYFITVTSIFNLWTPCKYCPPMTNIGLLNGIELFKNESDILAFSKLLTYFVKGIVTLKTSL